MNENINLVEILRDVPEGTQLWSPVCGNIKFLKVTDDKDYPIKVEGIDDYESFTAEGYIYKDHENAECVLFPSRDQRDWSKFVLPNRKKMTVYIHPFDRVLVRDDDDEVWKPAFFACISDNKIFPYVITGLSCCKQLIPYNVSTAHLVDTTQDCPVDYDIKIDNSYTE